MEPPDNHWYVIASSRELKRNKPLAKRRFGERLVLFRDEEGKAVGMRDQCPHRGAALSGGRLVDGCIECPYHGFRFTPEGRCVLTPQEGDKPIPRRMRARPVALRERYDMVWMWRGESRAQLPDPPEVPELERLFFGELITQWNAHYSRVLEAQIDYGHLPYVHGTTIGMGMHKAMDVVCEPDDHGFHSRLQSGPAAGKQYLNFRYPNLWVNVTGPELAIAAAFAPIDAQQTETYVRFYHRFTSLPGLRHLISWVGARGSWLVVRQDIPVVEAQLPQDVDAAHEEQLLSADVNVAAYRRLRRRHMHAAQEATVPHAPAANDAGTGTRPKKRTA